MVSIRQAFEELKAMRFPSFPTDADLDGIVTDLGELDGYVAGLASSALGGAAVDTDRLLREVDEFWLKLAAWPSGGNEGDLAIWGECDRYVACLHQLAVAVGAASK